MKIKYIICFFIGTTLALLSGCVTIYEGSEQQKAADKAVAQTNKDDEAVDTSKIQQVVADDLIFFKNGDVWRGKILEISPLAIRFQTKQAAVVTVNRANVEKTTKDERIELVDRPKKNKLNKPFNAVTFGLLQGGALVGIDYEVRFGEVFGLQAGMGFVGAAGAMNFHFHRGTNGLFLSFNYKNVGFGYVSTVGVELGLRAFVNEYWGFNFQLGYGFFVDRSLRYQQDFRELNRLPGLLTYSFGLVF
jgi:hypothetical protein